MDTADPGIIATNWIACLREAFEQQANLEVALQMSAYMRDQFPFFGIKTPARKKIVSAVLKQLDTPPLDAISDLFKACFDQPEREFQYVVNDLGRRWVNKLSLSDLEVIESLIGVKSWWDTVDFLAPKLVGRSLLRFPGQLQETVTRWIESDNFWYQRSAILLQLDYKAETDQDLLFSCILRRADSTEFFVQKGAGWALRQYSKIYPKAVADFIEKHPLSPLTVREGSRLMIAD